MLRCTVPLGSHPRVGKTSEQVHQCMPVARKRRNFVWIARLKFGRVLGQFCVRQTRVSMMYAMVGFMEQRERNEPAE